MSHWAAAFVEIGSFEIINKFLELLRFFFIFLRSAGIVPSATTWAETKIDNQRVKPVL